MRGFKAALCIAGLSTLLGCLSDLKSSDSSDSPETNGTGGLALGLAVAPGIDLTEVAYEVTVPSLEPIKGTFPVGTDVNNPIAGTIVNIPAGASVTVTLSGSTPDGTTCRGEGAVTVLAGQTTTVFIVLQCRLKDGSPTVGSVDVSGSINVCPVVQSATATPTSVAVGAAANVTAAGNDLDGDTLTFAWTASAGTFASASSASTAYTCSAAGEQTLTVTVDDGEGCTHAREVRVTCTPAAGSVCGNSSVEAGETCDDGNTAAGDGCSATCTVEAPAPACGDGTVNAGEACDDGNTAAGDGCSATCSVEAPGPACGDGTVDAGEACDDGNVASGDGCSATCTTEQAAGLCEAPPADACESCTCTTCQQQATACRDATGVAAAGPAQGSPKADLCLAVLECGASSGCKGNACYCGTASLLDCLLGQANGPCQDPIEAAAESTDLATISNRQSDLNFAVGLANAVSSCVVSSCAVCN